MAVPESGDARIDLERDTGLDTDLDNVTDAAWFLGTQLLQYTSSLHTVSDHKLDGTKGLGMRLHRRRTTKTSTVKVSLHGLSYTL